MKRRAWWKWGGLLAALAALSLVIGICIRRENTVCMGVPILQETQYEKLPSYAYEDLHQVLLQNGQPAAVDVKTSTIYISQNIANGTQLRDLVGTLVVQLPGCRLYFAPDAAFADLAAAAEQGHRFQLLAVTDGTRHMRYDVIFTSVPVMTINGVVTGTDEEGRDIWSGNLCLWTALDPAVDRYTVKTSGVQWHIRGRTTAALKKKSWKLSLKDSANEGVNEDFLGLGADDDWILNAMGLDDLKVRELLTMDLWKILREGDTSTAMSGGHYVEVLNNGVYQGLYLLQRRVDKKWLSLDSDAILLKGTQEGLEVVTSPYDENKTLEIASPILQTVIPDQFNLDNWIDTELLLQIGHMADNSGISNMYYLFTQDSDGWHVSLIPWDTDMSFGIHWDDQFVCVPDKIWSSPLHRWEYGNLRAVYADLDTQLSQRWQDLRKGALSNHTILSLAAAHYRVAHSSGAFQRDRSLWGAYYKGADTYEGFVAFIEKRLAWLDSYYRLEN